MIKGYVGIPYVDGGRDHGGCDCFGLVRLVIYEQAGIELPSYDLVSASDMLRVMRCIERERAVRTWLPVDRPQPLDVVLMAHHRRPDIHVHVGVMVSADMMLHTEESAAAHTTAVREPLVSARIRGFFRHQRLATNLAVRHAA